MPIATLRLTGPDAERYLNGQITNDTRRATSDGIPACITDAKGRIEAVALIKRSSPDEFTIEATCDDADDLFNRLDRYLIADDCKLELVASRDIPTLSSEENDQRIRAGEPAWGREITLGTFPAELGFDQTHVSFSKGCYIGQEVISRIKSAGKVNRQLAKFSVNPPIGDVGELLNAEGKIAGEITSVATTGDSALGFITRKGQELSEYTVAGTESIAHRAD